MQASLCLTHKMYDSNFHQVFGVGTLSNSPLKQNKQGGWVCESEAKVSGVNRPAVRKERKHNNAQESTATNKKSGDQIQSKAKPPSSEEVERPWSCENKLL